jgi:hypothetical protein
MKKAIETRDSTKTYGGMSEEEFKERLSKQSNEQLDDILDFFTNCSSDPQEIEAFTKKYSKKYNIKI